MKATTLILTIACSLGLQAFADSLFVQAAKTSLRAEPKMDSSEVTPLVRGDELEVLKVDGSWVQAKAHGQTGWVSKLLTSKIKPVGAATLNTDIKADLSKTSRRRSNSYDVSASTRGLTANTRSREGQDAFRADFESLERIEKKKLNKQKLDQFKKDGELGK